MDGVSGEGFVKGSRGFMILGVLEILLGTALIILAVTLFFYLPYGSYPALHVTGAVESALVLLSGILCVMCSSRRYAKSIHNWLILHAIFGCTTVTVLVLDCCLIVPTAVSLFVLGRLQIPEGQNVSDLHSHIVAFLYLSIIVAHVVSFLVLFGSAVLSLVNLLCFRRGLYRTCRVEL